MSTEYDIETGWKPYQRFMETPQLAGLVERPVSILGEAPDGIIPSIVLAPDGPQLATLFLVTRSFISEVNLDGSTFDLVDRHRVLLMRWFFRRTPFHPQPDAPAIAFKSVILRLEHGSTATQLSFVGEDPEAWVAEVRRLLPSSLAASGVGGSSPPIVIPSRRRA